MIFVKIKDIPGALVEKKEVGIDKRHLHQCLINEGFNEAITQQGEVRISLNRERLARNIYEKECELEGNGDYFKWESIPKEWNKKNRYYELADVILTDLKDLLEVNDEKSI